MAAQPGVLMGKLRPYWGRILVLDSPVEEAQHPSGLVVPLRHDHDQGVQRAVVVHVDEIGDGFGPPPRLAIGTVVFYRGGVHVGDVVVLDPPDILAYESDDD